MSYLYLPSNRVCFPMYVPGDYSLLVCPGIANHSQSLYIQTFVHHAQRQGFRVAVLNHLGAPANVALTSPRIFTYGRCIVMTRLSVWRHFYLCLTLSVELLSWRGLTSSVRPLTPVCQTPAWIQAIFYGKLPVCHITFFFGNLPKIKNFMAHGNFC